MMGRTQLRVTCIMALLTIVCINTVIFLSSYDPSPVTQVILVADDGEDRPVALPQAAPPRKQQVDRNTHFNTSWSSKKRVHLMFGSMANKLVVHSYEQGGGGVASEALNLLINEVFFLYQPLYKLAAEESSPEVNLLDMDEAKQGVEWLQQVFNCSLAQQKDLLHKPFLWKSHSVRYTYTTQCHNHKVNLGECVERACTQRGFRAVYTPRLGMPHIHQLVKVYTKYLKVVMVLRDPRAVLSARRQAKRSNNINNLIDFKTEASELCTTMAADIDQANLMRKHYKDSVMVLRYEHLLLQPYEVLSYLYDFLGLQVTDDQLERVVRILRLNRHEQLLLEITKMWQLDLTLQESRAVDEGCDIYYDKLGYISVPETINPKNNYFITWDQAKLLEDIHSNRVLTVKQSLLTDVNN
ncbi:uncharacterized protein [Cherax quadricarinatus]|uniref:uncharacterized protein isoform X2 n=1 Tax=Cherax quadricarinatus TaxID=27406 RepID=UPI00387EA35A